jgi:hypothetical protein
MSNRHCHADLIHAWAEGAEIQGRANDDCNWIDLHPTRLTWADNVEYRIKPEKKPDVVKYGLAKLTEHGNYFDVFDAGRLVSEAQANCKLTFSGETGELLSAEVLK